MHSRWPWLTLTLLAFGAGAWAQDLSEPRILRVCIADVDAPGFSHPDHEGLGQIVLRKAALRQGWHVQYVPQPWRRCLADTASGAFQAILPASSTAENLQRPRFPQVDGKPDLTLALSDIRMVAIRLRGSTAEWDGQRFSGVSGPVLYVAGINPLRAYFTQLRQAANSSARKPEYLGRMLLAGRSNMAVDWESRALSWTTQDEFRGRLEVLPQPLLILHGFVAVSPGLYDASTQAVEQLWRDTAQFYKDASVRRRLPR